MSGLTHDSPLLDAGRPGAGGQASPQAVAGVARRIEAAGLRGALDDPRDRAITEARGADVGPAIDRAEQRALGDRRLGQPIAQRAQWQVSGCWPKGIPTYRPAPS
jgi:hypothetical protein